MTEKERTQLLQKLLEERYQLNKEIENKNKKQKGGNILQKIDDNEILYLLIPTID